MDRPIFVTYGDGMDGLTDPFMDTGKMAEFIYLLFSSEDSMDISGMYCSCESDSSLLHISCDSDESFEEFCEEGECFSQLQILYEVFA